MPPPHGAAPIHDLTSGQRLFRPTSWPSASPATKATSPPEPVKWSSGNAPPATTRRLHVSREPLERVRELGRSRAAWFCATDATDEGRLQRASLWPISYALTKLTDTEEIKIAKHVKKEVS
jgi:hypothetical protein